MLKTIEKILNDILRAKGLPPVTLTRESSLLDGRLGIDSLDLAGLVVELQGLTGRDPFAESFVGFQTAGELADLFSEDDRP
jgi:acyl carrier protein